MSVRRICSEDICLWPDGVWCFYEELEEFVHMTDDFEVIPYDSIRWHEIIEDGNEERNH